MPNIYQFMGPVQHLKFRDSRGVGPLVLASDFAFYKLDSEKTWETLQWSNPIIH